MRRALRRAAQVFVAAGAFGLVSPALAQSSQQVGKRLPAPSSAKVTPVKAEMPSAPAAVLDEMQVELAWLANPGTFHHTLGAHVVGANLEVRGYVPNVGIKEQAFQIAREHTALPIVDKLHINPNLSIPVWNAPVAELRQSAVEMLADSLGEQGTALEITARDNGVVTVKGITTSVEEKLAISRKMRLVSGCSAVVNQVRVTQVVRAGHLVTQLSADGSQVLGDLPLPPPVPSPAPPMVSPIPMKMPEKSVVVTPVLPDHTAPVVVKPKVPDNTVPVPTIKPSLSQSGSGAITAAPSAPSTLTRPSTGSSDAAKPPVVTSSPAWTDKPVAAKTSTTLDSTPKTTPPATQPPTTTAAKPNPTVDSPVLPSPYSGKWPAAHEEKPARAAYVTTGTVVFDDDLTPPALPVLKPVPAPAPSATSVKPPLTPSAPSASTTIAPTPVKPQPVVTPVTMTTTAPKSDSFVHVPNSPEGKLQQQIKTICGKQAREVQVVVTPDKMMHVLVQVDDAKAQVPLQDKILDLPEMAKPNVRLEIQVMK